MFQLPVSMDQAILVPKTGAHGFKEASPDPNLETQKQQGVQRQGIAFDLPKCDAIFKFMFR